MGIGQEKAFIHLDACKDFQALHKWTPILKTTMNMSIFRKKKHLGDKKTKHMSNKIVKCKEKLYGWINLRVGTHSLYIIYI